ncbi:MAG TPA: alpha/beta hydrolase [Chromatiales bacterium]|nr:alpha/beta hydrolase [Chromatiales bacterium]
METKKTLDLDGFSLTYWLDRVAGARHTLVMVHGLASNHTRWTEFVESTRLRGRWNLLRLDQRGHGESMYRGAINRERWVADLDALIRAEGLAPVVLLGHSLGVETAMDYTVTHPGRVEGLIVIDPVIPEYLTGLLGWSRRLHWLLKPVIWLIRLANRLGLRRRHFPPRDLYALDRRTRATLAAHPGMRISELYMNPSADFPYIPLANYLQDLYEVVRPLPDLSIIRVPTLVIMSSHSTLSDIQKSQIRLRAIPRVEIREIECDHWPLTEKPGEVRQVIDEWCGKTLP